MEDGFPDDERGDQGLAGLGSPHCFPHQNGDRVERYSRKVFVGGLPPDIDEDEITASFRRFGHLFVDWPHKAESKSYFPPKGASNCHHGFFILCCIVFVCYFFCFFLHLSLPIPDPVN